MKRSTSPVTGLFFGSFNPVHIGHLAIANYMVEYTEMKKLWFIISPQNPFKNKENLLADNHRLELVRRAIDDHPKLLASNFEFKLPQPSYTIDTLAKLRSKYPGHDFRPIIGQDNLMNFHKWKNHEQILENYKIYVYLRPGCGETRFDNHPNIQFVNAPLMEISSSFIRRSIEEKKDMRFFMPCHAYDYLKEMNFYKRKVK